MLDLWLNYTNEEYGISKTILTASLPPFFCLHYSLAELIDNEQGCSLNALFVNAILSTFDYTTAF
jgi:hypothetical protein